MNFLVKAGLILIIIIGSSLIATNPPLPPPASPVAIGVLAPATHTWIVITTNVTNTVVQTAPETPIIVYVQQNITASVDILETGEHYIINGTSERATIKNSAGQGVYLTIIIRTSSHLIKAKIYVMTTLEEATQVPKPPQLDPSWLKWLRAIISASIAVLAGYPLGVWLKHRVVSRKSKKKKREEL